MKTKLLVIAVMFLLVACSPKTEKHTIGQACQMQQTCALEREPTFYGDFYK